MKQLLVFCVFIVTLTCHSACFADSSWHTERFGFIRSFQKTEAPKATLIFFAEDSKETDVIKSFLVSLDLLVVQIHPKEYLKNIQNDAGNCSYLAGEVTRLNQSAQSTLKIKSFSLPFLAGYGSGTALAEKIVRQFPKDYRGLITFAPCAQCTINRALCADSTNPIPPALRVTAEMLSDPEQALWQNSVSSYFSTHVEQTYPPVIAGEEELQEIPFIEVSSSSITKDVLAIIISGDGGWADIDVKLASFLGNRGYPVVGLDALRYFWNRKTPEESAAAISKLLAFFKNRYHTRKAMIIGYSLGADVTPFIANRLPDSQKNELASVVLLNPSPLVTFEMHITDWLGMDNSEGALPIEPELRKINFAPLVCIYGDSEETTGCQSIIKSSRTKVLPGDHHFNGDYDLLGKTLLTLSGLSDQ